MTSTTITPRVRIACGACEQRYALQHDLEHSLWLTYAELIADYCFVDLGELVLNELALSEAIHNHSAVAGCTGWIVITDERYSFNIPGDTALALLDALCTYDKLTYPAGEYPALRAWMASSTCVVNPSNDLPVVADFHARLFGTFDSYADFAAYLADEPGYEHLIPRGFVTKSFAAVTIGPDDVRELVGDEFFTATAPIAVFRTF